MSIWEKAYAHVRKWEGGYSNHPNDSGGATINGITQRWQPDTFNKVMGMRRAGNQQGAEAVVKDYYHKLWIKSGAHTLENTDPALALTHFDMYVNAGPGNAKKILAQAGNSAKKYNDLREAHYRRIAGGKNSVFLKGWMNRLNDARKYEDNPNAPTAEYDKTTDVSGTSNAPSKGPGGGNASGQQGGGSGASKQGSGSGASGKKDSPLDKLKEALGGKDEEKDKSEQERLEEELKKKEEQERKQEEEQGNGSEKGEEEGDVKGVGRERKTKEEETESAKATESMKAILLAKFVEYLEPEIFETIHQQIMDKMAVMSFVDAESANAYYFDQFIKILEETEFRIYDDLSSLINSLTAVEAINAYIVLSIGVANEALFDEIREIALDAIADKDFATQTEEDIAFDAVFAAELAKRDFDEYADLVEKIANAKPDSLIVEGDLDEVEDTHADHDHGDKEVDLSSYDGLGVVKILNIILDHADLDFKEVNAIKMVLSLVLKGKENKFDGYDDQRDTASYDQQPDYKDFDHNSRTHSGDGSDHISFDGPFVGMRPMVPHVSHEHHAHSHKRMPLEKLITKKVGKLLPHLKNKVDDMIKEHHDKMGREEYEFHFSKIIQTEHPHVFKQIKMAYKGKFGTDDRMSDYKGKMHDIFEDSRNDLDSLLASKSKKPFKIAGKAKMQEREDMYLDVFDAKADEIQAFLESM